jgi:hypothetical protein
LPGFVLFLNPKLIVTELPTQRASPSGFDDVTYLIHWGEEQMVDIRVERDELSTSFIRPMN